MTVYNITLKYTSKTLVWSTLIYSRLFDERLESLYQSPRCAIMLEGRSVNTSLQTSNKTRISKNFAKDYVTPIESA